MDSLLNKSTLDPLPPVLQHGLIAVSIFGLLSFFASFALLLYLTFKLFTWWRKGDLDNGCNQFLLLIYNLALADLQQSVAFVLTAVWLGENKIDAASSTCFAEGWFVSTGDLASGVWVLAIAVHTFYAVVKGRRLHTITFLVIVAGLWTFIYAMAGIGIAMHPHDYYIRASAWVRSCIALRIIANTYSAGLMRHIAQNVSGYTTYGSSSVCSGQSQSTSLSSLYYELE